MKFAISAAALIFSFSLCAQDSTKITYSTYYYQKASLFRLLPNDDNEIIMLGNSITDCCEWTELFRDRQVKNRGISGDITDGVLDRLDEITESKPLKIFLMIGVNDLSLGKSEDYIAANIQKIIQRIRKDSESTRIYLQSVLPVNDSFPRFADHVNKTEQIIHLNQKLEQLAARLKVTYIDLHSSFTVGKKLNPDYTNDGLHLTGAGYVLWKSLIEKYIED